MAYLNVRVIFRCLTTFTEENYEKHQIIRSSDRDANQRLPVTVQGQPLHCAFGYSDNDDKDGVHRCMTTVLVMTALLYTESMF